MQARWDEYAAKLFKIEDELGSMLKDWFLKRFDSEAQEYKDNMLNGIEATDYTK